MVSNTLRWDAHFKLYPPLFGLPGSPGGLGMDDFSTSLSEEIEVRSDSWSLEDLELWQDNPQPLWTDGDVEWWKDEAELKWTFGSGVGIWGCCVDVLHHTSLCMVIVGGAETKWIMVFKPKLVEALDLAWRKRSVVCRRAWWWWRQEMESRKQQGYINMLSHVVS